MPADEEAAMQNRMCGGGRVLRLLAVALLVGPGLGDTIGPRGNYSSLPDLAKWILTFGMLLGRLEILAVLVILTPLYWSR